MGRSPLDIRRNFGQISLMVEAPLFNFCRYYAPVASRVAGRKSSRKNYFLEKCYVVTLDVLTLLQCYDVTF